MRQLKTKETKCHTSVHGKTATYFAKHGCRCPEAVADYIRDYRERNLKEKAERRHVDWVLLYRAQQGEVVGQRSRPLSKFEHEAVFIHLVKLGRSNKEIARIMEYRSWNASSNISGYKRRLRAKGLL